MVGGDKPRGPYGPSSFVRNVSVGGGGERRGRAGTYGETVKKQPNQYITAPLIPVVGGDKPGRPYGPSPFVRNVSVGPMDRARRGT